MFGFIRGASVGTTGLYCKLKHIVSAEVLNNFIVASIYDKYSLVPSAIPNLYQMFFYND